jgi:hypothetical protein
MAKKTYSLLGDYWMADTEASSMIEAIKYFRARYSGKYTVICRETEQRKIVKL